MKPVKEGNFCLLECQEVSGLEKTVKVALIYYLIIVIIPGSNAVRVVKGWCGNRCPGNLLLCFELMLKWATWLVKIFHFLFCYNWEKGKGFGFQMLFPSTRMWKFSVFPILLVSSLKVNKNDYHVNVESELGYVKNGSHCIYIIKWAALGKVSILLFQSF